MMHACKKIGNEAPHQRPGMSSFSLITSFPMSAPERLRLDWQQLLATADDPFGIYQSPQWFEYMRESQEGIQPPHSLAVRMDSNQSLVAIVPLYVGWPVCKFHLLRGRYYRPSWKMVTIASGQLMLPPGDDWLDDLFSSIAEKYPRNLPLKIESAPLNGPLDDYIGRSDYIRKRYLIHKHPFHDRISVIPLAASYTEFLSRYGSKKRYNLRRQLRLLREQMDGTLELRVIRSGPDLPEFLDSLRSLFGWDVESRAKTPRSPGEPADFGTRLGILARLDLLRSYMLMGRGCAIACIYGLRFGGTYMLGSIVHDPAFDEWSPGTSLLQMVIEDLINVGSITRINLGYGKPPVHESRSTYVYPGYASYVLLPKTLGNRTFMGGLKAIRAVVLSLKAARAALPIPGRNRRGSP